MLYSVGPYHHPVYAHREVQKACIKGSVWNAWWQTEQLPEGLRLMATDTQDQGNECLFGQGSLSWNHGISRHHD